MRRVGFSAALCLAAVPLALLLAPSARAEFGPIQLVSQSTLEQAEKAGEPAISADGTYVVFAGRIGGNEGVFRKDLETGEIVLVFSERSVLEENKPEPSVSADGRYVAFTTREQLNPGEDPQEDSDVYVADLSTTPPTYELASTRVGCTGSSCSITYEGEQKNTGSSAAGRVAISADGRRVVFITHAPSNLAGPETPAGEIAVHDFGTGQTELISVARGTDSPVVGGGSDRRVPGAAISADGSTVAWVGLHLPEQVPMLKDEAAAVEKLEAEPTPAPTDRRHEYLEPLWRRVPSALEPDPATRRVVGGGDPSAPGCPPDGTLSDPACQGPYPDLEHERLDIGDAEEQGLGWGTMVPQLSADGSIVASLGYPEENYDLFVIDMAPGLSRKQAVRQVTRWTNLGTDPLNQKKEGPYGAPLTDVAISPDGNRIAFTTQRQIFPLAPPSLITAVPPGPSELPELYQVDLAGGTIERVTPGNGGSASLGNGPFTPEVSKEGAAAPSYSEGGRLLAFSSNAYNLVGGDTNFRQDVFLVENDPPRPVLPSSISPTPANPVPVARRFSVKAVSRPDGSIGLIVAVPASGNLKVTAAAPLGPSLRRRPVASLRMRPALGSVLRVGLRLPRPLQHLARRKDGLYTRIVATFTPAGGKAQRSTLAARFRVHQKQKKAKR